MPGKRPGAWQPEPSTCGGKPDSTGPGAGSANRLGVAARGHCDRPVVERGPTPLEAVELVHSLP